VEACKPAADSAEAQLERPAEDASMKPPESRVEGRKGAPPRRGRRAGEAAEEEERRRGRKWDPFSINSWRVQ
jgi:hypothetical protein